jgi:N-acetylmuramoyl-L-alanine amidase
MPSILFYFLQVVIVSGILYGYYLFALRNKRFHQYNRFYLLSIFIISWLIPLLRISLPVHSISQSSKESIKFFEVMADNNTHFEEYVTGVETKSQDWNELLFVFYVSIAVILILKLVFSILRILRKVNRSSKENIGNVVLVKNEDEASPFSFMHYVFWNKHIDVNTTSGKLILEHELTHVKEKHSYDIIFSSVIIAIGWMNPIFWLVQRELKMVHEFIADNKAVNNNASDFASMLLVAAFPKNNLIAHSFFHSPIKRRLTMIRHISLAKYPYMRRLLILPLLVLVVALFAFRKEITTVVQKTESKQFSSITEVPVQEDKKVTVSQPTAIRNQVTAIDLKNSYTIMIDAGHGGHDGGAEAEDGTKESEIALELAITVRDLNTNKNLNLILTRNYDVYQHPTEKVNLFKEKKADLVVSLHVASNPDKKTSGIEIYIPGSDTINNYKSSYDLANHVANSLVGVNTKVQIKQRLIGIWVINKAERPAILVEAGFLSNKSDLEKLKTKDYQEKLAKAILSGVEEYLKSKE